MGDTPAAATDAGLDGASADAAAGADVQAADAPSDTNVSDAGRDAPASSIPKNGLIMWLLADKGVHVDGGVVHAWTDQSTGMNDAIEAIPGPAGRLVTNVQNGLPAVHAEPAEGFTPTGAGPSSFSDFSGGISIFMIVKTGAVTDAGANPIFFWLGSSRGTLRDLIRVGRSAPPSTGDWFFDMHDGVAAGVGKVTASGNVEDGATHLYEVIVPQAASTVAPTTATLYRDGLSVATGAVNAATVIGRSYNFMGVAGVWDYGEVMLYKRGLGDSERQLVEAYLRARWGL